MGNSGPTLDKTAVKEIIHMQLTQFFQEMCKTKLYLKSQMRRPPACANFSEIVFFQQGKNITVFGYTGVKVGQNSISGDVLELETEKFAFRLILG